MLNRMSLLALPTLALGLAASPAIAAEPCEKHLRNALVAAAEAQDAINAYDKATTAIERVTAQNRWRSAQRDFNRARTSYNSAPPCGTGELNDDVPITFPPWP